MPEGRGSASGVSVVVDPQLEPDQGFPGLQTARLRLRRASGADFLALSAKLVAEPSRERGSGRPDKDWRFDPSGVLRTAGVAGNERRFWLVIEDRETLDVVGFTELLLPAPDGAPWIGWLVIEPRQRNRGLGGEVVAAVEVALAADGWSELRLSVELANTGARRFWERHGYREIRDGWRSYDGLAPTSLVLSKSLPP